MRNVLIIWRKELNSYFVSPIAYFLLALFGVVSAFFFWIYLEGFVQYGMEMQMRGEPSPLNLNEQMIRPLIYNAAVIGLFLIPMITMRLFAEEKRNGTIELLTTSPIRDIEVILGKWLAAVTLWVCMLLFTALNFSFLFKYGNPDWKPLVIGYLGLLLQGAALMALGIFISSLTKNQIIAGAATFAIGILLWVISAVGDFESTTWTKVFSYMSITNHLESFQKGVIDSKDAIYYATFIFLGLFLTSRSMESLRWRS
jgi:ABC-2 type transport system permease protein